GNVATNAGGMMAVKHGVTRNYVLGLEAVLPTGEVIQAGGKYIKSSTGYNLTQLLIGSEGTLAIITEVILRLVTPPGLSILLFVPFNSLSEAIGTVPAILQSKVLPTGIEFMERDVVEIAEKHTGRKIPHEGEAFLMILIEADDEQQAENMAWKVAEICGEHGAIDAFIAKTEQTMRPLLELRERFYPALKAVGTSDILDVVVPRDRIADFMGKVKAIAEKYHIPISGYGHAGDGNVHLHPFGDGKDMTEVYQAIYEAGAAMGGTISGEHGLGFDKKKFLPIVMDTKQIEIMRGIKRVFDPNNILNPGKVI
ncbi:MAG: FAD-binding protein, partial [Deltaproteobacteria bacterium]|nr:FAD-binding protein [Deltaproteobacteria bacterium]